MRPFTFPHRLSATLAAASLACAPIAASAAGNDRDAIRPGQVIAGAIVGGGLVALIHALGKNKRDREREYHRYYPGQPYNAHDFDDSYDYERYGDGEAAIEQCVGEARDYLADHNMQGKVDQITDIDRTGKGYDIDGHVVVTGDDNGDFDQPTYATFVCRVDYGRIGHFAVEGLN